MRWSFLGSSYGGRLTTNGPKASIRTWNIRCLEEASPHDAFRSICRGPPEQQRRFPKPMKPGSPVAISKLCKPTAHPIPRRVSSVPMAWRVRELGKYQSQVRLDAHRSWSYPDEKPFSIIAKALMGAGLWRPRCPN